MPLQIESATILTLSIVHLHPETIALLDEKSGKLDEGPSIAVRQEGFLVNSHRGDPAALEHDTTAGRLPLLLDRHPDLTLIRALARGLGAEWINIDQRGVVYENVLPVYQKSEAVILPEAPIWDGACVQLRDTVSGVSIVVPSIETLENMERIADQDMTPEASVSEGPC